MIGQCKSCEQEKSLQMYRKARGGKSYYREYCVQCWSISRREYQTRYRLEHSERLNEYHKAKYLRTIETGRKVRKRYYEKWKKVVFDHYGHECSCCGETQPKFLTIDHVNDDGAKHRKTVSAGSILFRVIANEGFPSAYRILCFNCNSGRYHNGGVCPHEISRLNYTKPSDKYQPSNWII